ncbi:hypothetical protein FRC01_013662, partial [Tulasnella sp. 417]
MIPPQHFPWRTSPPNWRRFEHYARRIRVLDQNDRRPYVLNGSPRTIPWRPAKPPIEFPKRPGTDPLLPKIQDLTWSVGRYITNLPHILPFISPSLKSLKIRVKTQHSSTDADVICPAFDALRVVAGLELETFHFVRHVLEEKVAERLSTFLEHQQNLKNLGIFSRKFLEPGPVKDVLFTNLPRGLQKLNACVRFSDEIDYINRIQANLSRLPNLRVL